MNQLKSVIQNLLSMGRWDLTLVLFFIIPIGRTFGLGFRIIIITLIATHDNQMMRNCHLHASPISIASLLADHYQVVSGSLAKLCERTTGVNANNGIISGVLVTVGDLARVIFSLGLHFSLYKLGGACCSLLSLAGQTSHSMLLKPLVTGSSSPSHKQASANNVNFTSVPNHVAPAKQRSMKQTGGNSSANVSANGVLSQPPPTSQYSVVEDLNISQLLTDKGASFWVAVRLGQFMK